MSGRARIRWGNALRALPWAALTAAGLFCLRLMLLHRGGAAGSLSPAAGPATWMISIPPASHCTISPPGPEAVTAGGSATFEIRAEEGWHVTRVLIDGRNVGTPPSYAFNRVAANHTLAVEVALNTYRVSVLPGPNGTVSPIRPAPVAYGGNVRFRALPRPGYHLDSLLVDGAELRAGDRFALRKVTGAHTVRATFALNAYNLLATAGPHARIDPAGLVSVPHGASQTFTFDADSGYTVCEITLDGRPVRVGSSYTLYGIRDHHRIEARVTHQVATITAPEDRDTWTAGEIREITWQPLNVGLADSAEVRVSYHGLDGPWQPVWRGLLRTGSAQWKVPPLDCDSVAVCLATIGRGLNPGLDFGPGLVRVRAGLGDEMSRRFYVRAVPSPLPVGPVRIDFGVPVMGDAQLEIFTVSGREVWRKPLGRGAGEGSLMWDATANGGRRAEPGVYFARLTTAGGERTCRLVFTP